MKIATLRKLIIVNIVFAFISGPTYAVGPLDLRILDLTLLVLALAFGRFLVNNPSITLPRKPVFFGSVFFYLSLAIGLPIAGFVIYSYPVGYVVGDLRWIQALILVIAILWVATHTNPKFSLIDLITALKVIVMIELVVTSLQITHEIGWFDTMFLLEVIREDPDFHIYRFGGTGSLSSLGLTGSVGILFFSYTVIGKRENFIYLVISVFLLIASGHRTSIVAVLGIIGILFVCEHGRSWLPGLQPKRVVLGSGLGVSGFYILYYFNIGRIRTSDRYNQMIGLATGEFSFHEVSGRGGERWGPMSTYVEQHYPYGTLSNPSWVIDHLPTIDGYFVLTYLQGGIIFTFSYVALLTILLLIGINQLGVDSEYGMIILGLISIIAANSLTANFMTSVTAKVLLLLTILLVILSMQNDFTKTKGIRTDQQQFQR